MPSFWKQYMYLKTLKYVQFVQNRIFSLLFFHFTKVAFLTWHIFTFSILPSLINLIMLYSAHFSISFGITFQHHPRAQIFDAFKNEWALPRSSILLIREYFIYKGTLTIRWLHCLPKEPNTRSAFSPLIKSHIVTLNNYTTLKAMPRDIVYIEKDKKTRKCTLLKC